MSRFTLLLLYFTPSQQNEKFYTTQSSKSDIFAVIIYVKVNVHTALTIVETSADLWFSRQTA